MFQEVQNMFVKVMQKKKKFCQFQTKENVQMNLSQFWREKKTYIFHLTSIIQWNWQPAIGIQFLLINDFNSIRSRLLIDFEFHLFGHTIHNMLLLSTVCCMVSFYIEIFIIWTDNCKTISATLLIKMYTNEKSKQWRQKQIQYRIYHNCRYT